MPATDDYYSAATKRNIGIVTVQEQQRLRRARVAIVGMGGGGGIYLTTLVRMGVGHFHIADIDNFSVVNVNRQAGAMQSTIGLPKTQVMAALARDIHPGVEVRTFDSGIGPHNVETFLQGVEVVVDAIDVFAQPARLLLYQTARRLGLPVLFGAPLGLSATLGGFAPDGMRYEDYFDLREGLTPFEIMMRFVVGIAPKGRHWTYMDSSHVAPEDQAGPSSAAAISLLTGLVCTEVLVALLQRRPLRVAPAFQQFDPYLGRYWHGRLRWGNRGPLQRLKIWLAGRKFAVFAQDFNKAGFQQLPTSDRLAP
jgi:hypothetical protein